MTTLFDSADFDCLVVTHKTTIPLDGRPYIHSTIKPYQAWIIHLFPNQFAKSLGKEFTVDVPFVFPITSNWSHFTDVYWDVLACAITEDFDSGNNPDLDRFRPITPSSHTKEGVLYQLLFQHIQPYFSYINQIHTYFSPNMLFINNSKKHSKPKVFTYAP